MIDIGINLTSAQFAKDAPAVLARAFKAGVTGIILTGTTFEGSSRSSLLAAADKSRLSFTAGVHPHYANQWSQKDADLFGQLWANLQCVAVGECGLDYFRELSTKAQQMRAFEAQLKAALANKLPAFLHCRDAFNDFKPIIAEFVAQGGKGVVHCFTGSVAEAEAYLKLGLHIGITGWVTEQERGKALRDAVKIIPADMLHLETDAPYLVPRNRAETAKGRHRNEPAYLESVAIEVARLRAEPLEELKQRCESNSRSFFRLPKLA